MSAKRQLMAIVVLVGMVALSMPAMSQERDSDGTRMQARQVDVGTMHSDRLAPPEDKADWRMIQLEDEATLALRLSVEPSNRSAQLTLAGATGDELAVVQAGAEAATITQKLEAGIYYIAVESDESLSYELRID